MVDCIGLKDIGLFAIFDEAAIQRFACRSIGWEARILEAANCRLMPELGNEGKIINCLKSSFDYVEPLQEINMSTGEKVVPNEIHK